MSYRGVYDIGPQTVWLSPSQVEQQSRRLSDELFQARNLLQKIVERREETIRKRWRKKSNQQRKKILLEAWPDMSTQHRPDVEAWRRREKLKEAYMWPYINLQDLLKPRSLLLLLHARGRIQPHAFVQSDLEHARLGEITGTTRPIILHGYTMMFDERIDSATYGELVQWDDDGDAFRCQANGKGMSPGHGLQALEIQQRLWKFLVTCCELLLKDLSDLTTGIIQLRVESLDVDVGVTTLEDVNGKRMSAENDSLKDHLCSLHEDPGYFNDTMQDYAEHREEMVAYRPTQQHFSFRQSNPSQFWNRVIGDVVFQAHLHLETFDRIVKQIDGVRRLLDNHKEKISLKGDYPIAVTDPFICLRHLLDEMAAKIIDQLRAGFFASPPIRSFCIRSLRHGPHHRYRNVFQPLQSTHAVKRVVPLFEVLWNQDWADGVELHTFIAEIEQLLQTDPEASALISPWVAGRVSSLSIIAECLHQIHFFRPWARRLEDNLGLTKDQRLYIFKERDSARLPNIEIDLEKSSLCNYADPTDGKFFYPGDRKPTKRNIQLMRDAEANLDKFWEAANSCFQENAKTNLQPDLLDLPLRNGCPVQRTPPWIEREKPKNSDNPGVDTYQPFPSVLDHEVTAAFDRASISERPSKIKTRGTAAPAEPEEPIANIPHENAQAEKIFSVDKRAYKVFKTLFHSPSNPDQPGELPWQNFLHAMVSTGFSAEKLHGSAWKFTPIRSDLGCERGIQFHEPHPSDKLDFRVARRFGRRLTRAYGWSGESFRLR